MIHQGPERDFGDVDEDEGPDGADEEAGGGEQVEGVAGFHASELADHEAEANGMDRDGRGDHAECDDRSVGHSGERRRGRSGDR